MRKIITIVVICVATCTLWAQNEVSLVVSGEGKDKEEATLKALRSAIEQAYGTFVSANTTVLNDQLVADEIVSLSSGNIQKYEYVSENKMPNGNTFVTLSATVSIDKLVSFAESKGMEAELKGSLFAMNIKKMEFDKKTEEKAVKNLCKQLEAMLPSMFDYKIELGEPSISQDYSGYYDVVFRVNIVSNATFYTFCSILNNTMSRIAMDKNEMPKYEKVNAKIYETNLLAGPLYYVYNEDIKNKYNRILLPRFEQYLNMYNLVDSGFSVTQTGDTLSLFAISPERNDFLANTYLTEFLYPVKGDLFDIGICPFRFRSDSSITMIKTLFSKLYNYAYNFIIDDGHDEIETYVECTWDHSSIKTKMNKQPIPLISDIRYCYDEKNPHTDKSQNHQFWATYHWIECWNHSDLHTPWRYIHLYVTKNDYFAFVEATLHYTIEEISKITSITVRNAEYDQ